MCIYTHTRPLTDCRPTWSTVVASQSYCKWSILTQIGSGAKWWPYIYHWGANVTFTGRMRAIGQNVLQSLFEQEIAAAPDTCTFYFLLHSSTRTKLEMQCNNYTMYSTICGPGSSVGIATDYGLDGPGMESRWGARFSPHVQTAWGPSSLLYNGYRVFPVGKAAGAWCWPPTPPSAEVENE
jgi:hypothetical protein